MTHGHGHGHGDGALTPVEEHLAEILATISPLAPTELSLGDVHGLVLAEDVSTAGPLPSFDNSGMDGYAVRVEDVAAATEENPVTLPVTAEIAAGDTGAYALQPGHRHQDHDRGHAAARRRGRGAGGVDRRRQRPGHHPRPGPSYGNAVRLAGEDAKAGRGAGRRGHLAEADAHRGDRGRRARRRSWSGPGPGWWCCPPATSWPNRARRSSPGGSGTPTASCWPPRPGRRAAWPTGGPSCPTTRTRCCRPSRTSWSGPT